MSKAAEVRLSDILRTALARPASALNAPAGVTLDARGSFARPVLVFFLIAVGVEAVQMWQSVSPWHGSAVLAELVFFAGLAAAAASRAAPSARAIMAYSALCVALALLLNGITGANWGNLVLYAIMATTIYRLPWQWSLTVAAISTLIILWAEGLGDTLLRRAHPSLGVVVTDLLIIGFTVTSAASLRGRYLLIGRLERTQTRLRDEMQRTADLAAARERARIARDVHDVLAHSLTILSVQVQALRRLMPDQPERAATLLDDMAQVLRESQDESRQIVGLLREASSGEEAADLATRLHITAERFADRTGLAFTMREEGAPAHVDAPRAEALRYALQEALTNAHRHGRARTASVDLQWARDAVTLVVRDDGASAAATPSLDSTGNGLRGMRERAEALGGSASAGPQTAGGYRVGVTLPLRSAAREPEER